MLDMDEALAELFGQEAPTVAELPRDGFSVRGGRAAHDAVSRNWRRRQRRARERKIDRQLRLLRKSVCSVCFKPAVRYAGGGLHFCAAH